jgi:xanthosine phosphorylase
MSRADIDAAAAAVGARAGGRVPAIGLVMGSGLGAIAGRVAGAARVRFADIPGFPGSKVAGHAGELVLGTLGGQSVAVLSGRAHAYEGYAGGTLALPLRTLKALGCRWAVLVAAVGSINPKIRPGRIAAVSDHIVLAGANPLTGPNDESVGPRFPAMNDPYDPALRKLAKRAAARANVKLAEGVMAHWPGPSFETPAEIRALRRLGGDFVGMSMALETVVARHCGLKVLGLACVTNMGAGMDKRAPSHADTLKGAAVLAGDLERVLLGTLESWSDAA